MLKTCSKCKETKNQIRFHKNKSRWDGTSAYCNECMKLIRKNYTNNPKTSWARKLKTKYKISVKYYEILLQNQKNKCNICKKVEVKKDSTGKVQNLSVDHCHKTGKIRGLLCDKCNLGLGHFKDNVKYLKNAIKHLNNNRREKNEY